MFPSILVKMVPPTICRVKEEIKSSKPALIKTGYPMFRGYTSSFLLAMVIRFLENVASPVRGENQKCSPPRTGDATGLCFKCRKKFSTLAFSRFLFQRFFSSRITYGGWLLMRFSPLTGDATIFSKTASASEAKKSLVKLRLYNFLWLFKPGKVPLQSGFQWGPLNY